MLWYDLYELSWDWSILISSNNYTILLTTLLSLRVFRYIILLYYMVKTLSTSYLIKFILWVLVLWWSFFVLDSYATTKFQLQDWMEEKYLKHQSKQVLKDMVKDIDDNTNLHNNSLDAVRLNKIATIHDTINFIIDDVAAKYSNCVLNYDDVTTLLVSTSWFQYYLKWIAEYDDRFVYSIDQSKYSESCKKYLACFADGKIWDFVITNDQRNQCQNDMQKTFETAYAFYKPNNTIWDYSFWDEVFLNGSLEDGPFDIYYDIEQIHKILYANPTRIPNYYLWRPLWYEDNQPSSNLDYILADNGLPLWLIPVDIYAQTDPIQNMNIQDAINQIRWTEQSPQIVSNLQCLTWTNTANQIPISDQVKDEIEKVKWDILTFQEEVVVDNFVNDVLPSVDPTVWVVYQELIVLGGEDTDSDANTNPDDPDNSSNWPNGSNPSNNNNSNPSNSCPTNTMDIQQQFGINSDNPNIISCIQNCQNSCGWTKTSLNDDRVACYQSCLCGSKQWDRWPMSGALWGIDFGVRFCLVPSTTTDIITPGRQVLSIQELIDGINNITTKLKESWQVIPSSKKKEFFSPTVKVKKLVDVFNFSINTITKQDYKKPVSDQAQKIVQQDIFTSDVLDVTEQQIRWIYDKQTFIVDFLQIQDTFWTQVSEVINDRYAQISNVK